MIGRRRLSLAPYDVWFTDDASMNALFMFEFKLKRLWVGDMFSSKHLQKFPTTPHRHEK